jgi:hypothetical protein
MNGNRLIKPHTIRILWGTFAILLALSVVAEVFIHTHARFGIDGGFGFHAWFGGAACIGIIAIAKLLGIFLKRRDSYYDD